jgi:hypothetical protein
VPHRYRRRLSGLKDFPFAGTCNARFTDGGTAIVEVYHHFFKLSPNGVKYDPDFENMFCIKGISDSDQPKVVEFRPEFADTSVMTVIWSACI